MDTSPITSATAAINALAQSWQGLMRGDVQLPKEGLLNAFRHGKATTVSIRIISQGDPTPTEFVSMEVQDNEVGLSSEFVKGLGLTVSDCLNPSTCDLLPATRGGCHLLVEFP